MSCITHELEIYHAFLPEGTQSSLNHYSLLLHVIVTTVSMADRGLQTWVSQIVVLILSIASHPFPYRNCLVILMVRRFCCIILIQFYFAVIQVQPYVKSIWIIYTYRWHIHMGQHIVWEIFDSITCKLCQASLLICVHLFLTPASSSKCCVYTLYRSITCD